MSAQASRSDDTDIAERGQGDTLNHPTSVGSRIATSRNSSLRPPNAASSHEGGQSSASASASAKVDSGEGNERMDVEAAPETTLRRRSATSSTNSAHRRASRLSFNYSQGRSAQPHHHHHYHHPVPQPQNSFRPFTRESLEAIKRRISEENARKLQMQQAQEVVWQ